MSTQLIAATRLSRVNDHPGETVQRHVTWLDHAAKAPAGPADTLPTRLLLLGNSHTLVFHTRQDLHGDGVGLADQLDWEPGVPVEMTVLRRSKADPRFLAGKSLVPWCVAAREFTAGSQWSLAPLSQPSGREEWPRSSPREHDVVLRWAA